MPKIAQYEAGRVTTQVVSQPRAQSAPRGAFGESLARGISDIIRAGANIKQRIDVTTAEEALVNFERDKNNLFFDPDTGYFNTQGRDAYDRSNAAAKALEDLKAQYGESLSPSAKVLFDRSAGAHINRAQVDISRHASKGLKAWEVSTIEAQVENSIENASLYWNDPDRLKVQRVLGRQAIIDSSNMQGIGSEATAEKLQTYESTFAKTAIESAIRQSAANGHDALKSYGDQLEGPDRLKIQRELDKREQAEKTEMDARMAVTTSTLLVDRYDSRSDIVDEVNKIEDPELRKKTMSEAMSQFNRKKKAESEARATAFEDAEKHLMDGGSAESFKAANPEQWESLSPKQQKNIQSGKMTTTDWNVFSNLMLLPKAELAKVDPTDHYSDLAESERSKLISAVKSANGTGSSKDKIEHQAGRTRTTQTNAAVEQLFGKKSKWKKKDLERVDGFYSLLDEEVKFREAEKGAKLTSEEFTNLLSGLTRTVVQEIDWWPDAKLDLTDIPLDDITTLSKALRDKNKPVTADNIIRAYKQAKVSD